MKDKPNKLDDLPFGVVGGIPDLLVQRELIAAHAGADGIRAIHSGEVEAPFCYKINRDSDFKVFVQVLEISQHIRALQQNRNILCNIMLTEECEDICLYSRAYLWHSQLLIQTHSHMKHEE